MTVLRVTSLAAVYAAVLVALGSASARADGLPVRYLRGAVDVRVENGVRVWRPRPHHMTHGSRAAGMAPDGLAAHMLAGQMLHGSPYGGRPVGVIVPIETPVYVGGGRSSAFAPAPGKVGPSLRGAPLIGGSGRAVHHAPAAASRPGRGHLGR